MVDRINAFRILRGKSERTPLAIYGIDGKITLSGRYRIGTGAVYWIDLAHGKDEWLAAVNTVMFFRLNKMR
jgi:hypothetical protein